MTIPLPVVAPTTPPPVAPTSPKKPLYGIPQADGTTEWVYELPRQNGASTDYLSALVTELRAADRENRDPDPKNASNAAMAEHIAWIDAARARGGELYGTQLQGIANAFEALANGNALSADEIGSMMFMDSN